MKTFHLFILFSNKWPKGLLQVATKYNKTLHGAISMCVQCIDSYLHMIYAYTFPSRGISLIIRSVARATSELGPSTWHTLRWHWRCLRDAGGED